MGYKLQMSWMPSLLSQKRRNGPPLGLRNLGNTCYLNSVLQCLTYTPPLANFCLNHKHSSHCDSFVDGERKRECPFCIVEKRIARSLSVDHAIDTPTKISSCLKIFAEHFKFGRQEDAHEFLRYVIDACHNTSLRLKKLRTKGSDVNGNTVVKEIFGGALQSQVKCLPCGAESNKADEIMDISLEILHTSSVKESMQNFFRPEILDGNNKYRCESCKKLVTARKQMSVLQAPNILVIQLKRFEGIFGKIDKAITFGEILVLSTFMSKSSKDPQPEYKLFGIIVHSGFSPESGHYYAYVKDSLDRWYCCNDASVSHSTLQEVLSEKAYILFFSRSNQRPASAKTLVTSNGTTSHEANGCETPRRQKLIGPLNNVNMQPRAEQSFQKNNNNLASSNPHKFTRPPKDANMKPRGEQPFHKNNLASPEVEKAPLKPHAKISISVNLGAKRVSPTVNGRLSFDQDQEIAPEADKENIGSVSAKRVYTCSEKKFGTENGGNGVKENGSGQGGSSSSSSSNNKGMTLHPQERSNGSSNGGDHHKKDSLHPCKSNGSQNGTDHHQEIEEEGVRISQSKSLDSSTNEDDRCIFLRKDVLSRDQLEATKESLQKDVSSYLRSCGWYDKVHISMRSNKRLRAEQPGGDGEDAEDLKRRLIADVKSSFPQIPDELKANLVNRLRRIGKKKYS